jgi:hypothetical protein
MWSSSKVARWIEQKTGHRGVRAQRGWEYLRKLGNSPQVPKYIQVISAGLEPMIERTSVGLLLQRSKKP